MPKIHIVLYPKCACCPLDIGLLFHLAFLCMAIYAPEYCLKQCPHGTVGTHVSNNITDTGTLYIANSFETETYRSQHA